ncbi:MAG TPA: DUF2946 family protein [Noviherbaspirillum sp.]|jgi:hypothetical protein|uniref:DUF2946 family protein n=1 Tax=Noviherbaspirillum sp. TaxID=1926288 RepID=UPI002F91DCD8
MDDIVRQAMAKWPNVPHCYGWLALDARGNWRMRDERAQALKLPGDRIGNAALLAFINRNYTRDDRGRWYFQNGPQRVYVNLDATPFVARTDPALGFVLHTGEALPPVDEAWLTEQGQLLLKAGEVLALVDDRDMAQCLSLLVIGGKPVEDEQLLAWMEQDGGAGQALMLAAGGRHLPVGRIRRAELAGRFGFVSAPQAD